MILWLTIATAFGLGLLHALDADHVMAVTTFIARRPRPRDAVRFCLHWGVGHMAPLFALGVGGIAVGLRVPARFQWGLDLAVGGVFLVLGGLVFRDLWRRRIHLHRHDHAAMRHAHLHSHAAGPDHAHPHGPTLVGVIHGLAGTAPMLVVIPVAAMGSLWGAILYLSAFSLAVMGMMVVYGYSAASVLGRLAGGRPGLYRWILGGTGALSLGAGGLWIARLL